MLDDGERGLTVVVLKDEYVGGSGAAPRLADSAAAEYVFGWQPGEDLVDDEPLGQVVEDGIAAAVCHAGCLLTREKKQSISTAHKKEEKGFAKYPSSWYLVCT